MQALEAASCLPLSSPVTSGSSFAPAFFSRECFPCASAGNVPPRLSDETREEQDASAGRGFVRFHIRRANTQSAPPHGCESAIVKAPAPQGVLFASQPALRLQRRRKTKHCKRSATTVGAGLHSPVQQSKFQDVGRAISTWLFPPPGGPWMQEALDPKLDMDDAGLHPGRSPLLGGSTRVEALSLGQAREQQLRCSGVSLVSPKRTPVARVSGTGDTPVIAVVSVKNTTPAGEITCFVPVGVVPAAPSEQHQTSPSLEGGEAGTRGESSLQVG